MKAKQAFQRNEIPVQDGNSLLFRPLFIRNFFSAYIKIRLNDQGVELYACAEDEIKWIPCVINFCRFSAQEKTKGSCKTKHKNTIFHKIYSDFLTSLKKTCFTYYFMLFLHFFIQYKNSRLFFNWERPKINFGLVKNRPKKFKISESQKNSSTQISIKNHSVLMPLKFKILKQMY